MYKKFTVQIVCPDDPHDIVTAYYIRDVLLSMLDDYDDVRYYPSSVEVTQVVTDVPEHPNENWRNARY